MERIIPHVTNETARLRAVVLGLPDSLGPIPTLQETYDAKSYEAVSRGSLPQRRMCVTRCSASSTSSIATGVRTLRPAPLTDYNQVFRP